MKSVDLSVPSPALLCLESWSLPYTFVFTNMLWLQVAETTSGYQKRTFLGRIWGSHRRKEVAEELNCRADSGQELK